MTSSGFTRIFRIVGQFQQDCTRFSRISRIIGPSLAIPKDHQVIWGTFKDPLGFVEVCWESRGFSRILSGISQDSFGLSCSLRDF